MVRQRVNVAFVDKGFIDPLIAQCCRSFSRAKDVFGLTFEKMYEIFNGGSKRAMSREKFMLCAQGLQADIATDDLAELFNYIDETKAN